jgi:hypothetical protein
MASVSVTRRKTRSGPRYVVRYRLGGRAYPLVHGGSFKTQKEARARRDYIAGELSAGRNPQEGLRAILASIAMSARSRTTRAVGSGSSRPSGVSPPMSTATKSSSSGSPTTLRASGR